MDTRTVVRGMTALEVMIASAIFAMVICLSFGLTHWTTKSFNEQIREATLVDKGEKALKVIQEDLADSTRVTVQDVLSGGFTFPAAEVRFKVPLRFASPGSNPKGYACTIHPVAVVYDAAGHPVNAPTFADDKDFRLVFGWRDNARFVPNLDDALPGGGNRQVPLQGPGLKPGGGLPGDMALGAGGVTQDGFVCFRYQMNPNVRVGKYGQNGLVSEAQEKIDLDGDGQMNSVYALGYIERSYWVGPAGAETIVQSSRQPVGDSCILQPVAITTGGDAKQLKTNRIFDAPPNPTRIEMCIWIMMMDGEGQVHMLRCTTADFLRNNAAYVTATSATGTN